MAASNEAAKLQQHLDLLREQYVKLQQRHAELEQRYTQAIATSGNVGPDHFVSRLLKVVADLFDKPLYSDISIMLADRKMAGHRFVLAARSRHWNPKDETLSSTLELDFTHMTPFVAASMLRWVYTDSVVLPSEQSAIIELLGASNLYHLTHLKEKCEQALISSVTVHNCIKLYQSSEEHSAENLKKYCLQIISSQWGNLNTTDFAELSAPLLYDMFKAHSAFPLHLAIQHLREDVVFLFLIEHNAQLPNKLDESDTDGHIPLNLALLNRHEGIANTLVSHKCDLDIQDSEGNSLLHLAILRGDAFAASFLIKNGANTIMARRNMQETPLHLVASYNPSQALTNISSVTIKEAPWPCDSMAQIASLLLEYHANPDSQDVSGCTPLQRAIECRNEEVFNVLLNNQILNLNLQNNNREAALWLALKQLDPAYLTCEDISQFDHTFAARLIKRGATPDATDARTGNSLLHNAALNCNEAAAVFLVHHGAVPNIKNIQGEAPIHIAAKHGLHRLVEVLLQYGADPNLQTALKPKPKAKSPTPIPIQSPSYAAATRLDDITSAILSPSTLGALSALNATSQVTSEYTFDGNVSVGGPVAGYSSQAPYIFASGVQMQATPSEGETQFRMSPWPQRSGSSLLGRSGGGGSTLTAPRQTGSPIFKKASTNPFGAGSDEEDEQGYPPAQSGYSVSRLPSHLDGSSEAMLAQGRLPGGRDSPVARGGRDSPLAREGRDSPLAREGRDSPFTRRGTVPAGKGMTQPAPLSPPPPPPTPNPSEVKEFIALPEQFDISVDPGERTALHLAIVHCHPKVVGVLLDYKGNSSSGKLTVDLNVNLRDGHGECPLGLALWTDQFDVASRLLEIGADIECMSSDEPGLLYMAIIREKSRACTFLLNNGANFKKRGLHGESLLILSICHQLESVVDHLCEMGVDLNTVDQEGNGPLWVALRSRQENIAGKLVVHGCDPNAWHMGSDGTTLTLLHRAILLKDTPTACFLIHNGADINSSSRPGKDGGEFSPPLHMACDSGMQEVVQCLVDHNANVNAKDSTGCSALHVSISCKQPQCSAILLSHPNIDLTQQDKSGNTPFAAALAARDHQAGLAILKREPKAAEQMDSRGQNFLHLAVLNEDVEGVIFLLSVRVDINSKVQNPTLNTPLHYAVKAGSEILVRHLLLAQARVSDVDNHQRGVMHMAAEGDFPTILSVLLENGADPDLMDEGGNNALHLSMQLGHLGCVRVLLEECSINLIATNIKGQNCLHMLSKHAKENAPIIFNLLMEVAPNYPINKLDFEGNTPLLLAYFGGSAALCDVLIHAGAHPGMSNQQGVSIFNAPVATKQLLFRILDQIHTEPTWLEGNFCLNCHMKFNISHRKHHCRHCGRLLCKQCTGHQIPILKFELTKPVRVCEVCADSFRLGSSR